MSHGQAHIERGFSINKEIVVENLHSKCLYAQRLVYDASNLSGKSVHEIDLPNKLVTSCIMSYSRYNAMLIESRFDKQAEEKSKKRKILQEEIANVERKKMELQSCIFSLEEHADKCYSEAEQQHEIASFLKANELQKASKF